MKTEEFKCYNIFSAVKYYGHFLIYACVTTLLLFYRFFISTSISLQALPQEEAMLLIRDQENM
jgi:hypothetical protein